MHKYRANYPDNESVAEKDIHKFLMTGKTGRNSVFSGKKTSVNTPEIA
jgi:hypothetical protein